MTTKRTPNVYPKGSAKYNEIMGIRPPQAALKKWSDMPEDSFEQRLARWNERQRQDRAMTQVNTNRGSVSPLSVGPNGLAFFGPGGIMRR